MLKENLKMSWQNIRANKMRSFLTILGIVIGVTAVITLVTIVEGLTDEIINQFSELGAGKITVQVSGTPLKKGLTDSDIQDLKKMENVSGVSPTLDFVSSAVRNGIVEEDVTVEGKNEVYFKGSDVDVSRGRAFNILDMQSKNKVCIINQPLSEILFFGSDPLGGTIQLGGTTYTVVGILGDGSSSDIMSIIRNNSGSDGKVINPYTTAMGTAGVGNITSLEIIIKDTDKTDKVIEDTELILNQAFNYKEDSFNIINIDSLIDALDTMYGMMTAVLAGVASIALLVGGIGIMNMMLVSVTERTTEIGLRKALGAEPGSIQLQFLIESIFLSVLGGIIGLVLGIALSFAACNAIGIDFEFSKLAISLGVGFSVAIGIIFGWAPARKASMLNPIDALRSV
jgi:putative ABC transport system permease protein